MRAKLKSIIVSDIDPESFWPEEEDNFGFYLQAIIGPDNEEGGDTFGFQICSPKWLMEEYKKSDLIFGRHIIIALQYDFLAIEKKISDLCQKSTGDSWPEIAKKLSRFGYWEFEDYRPAS